MAEEVITQPPSNSFKAEPLINACFTGTAAWHESRLFRVLARFKGDKFKTFVGGITVLQESARTRNRVAITSIISIIICIALLGGSPPGIAADRGVTDTGLPDELLDEVHSFYNFQGVSQYEAEALFGSAVAAIYYPDRGEVRLLASNDLATALERLGSRSSEFGVETKADNGSPESQLWAKLQATAAVSLRSFLDPVPSKSMFGVEIDGEPYLVKAPSFKSADSLPPETEPLQRREVIEGSKSYSYLYENFEQDTWSLWSRSDNTNGKYKWGVTSCDSNYGSYSADAARAGSQGAGLGCSSPYPKSAEMYMYFEACESVPSNYKAFLELQFKAAIDTDGDDGFGVYFKNPQGNLRGWVFWGTLSQWYGLVFNLKQWYGIGDLTNSYCNTLYLGFESDGTNNSGYGARVDDLYVFYGDTVGSYECGIIADPSSGTSPVTIAFRATTDMYSPSFYWRFGDGATSEERDPSHRFSSGGNYNVTLSTSDGYGTSCYASKTINVTQGTCSYSISPSSASYSASAGSGSISVSSTSGCSWNASASNSWISITNGSSGSGSGSVSYTVSANTSTSQRTGTIQVAGKTFNVAQAGATVCTYSISPTSRTFDANGGTATVSVSANSGCTWTASSNNSWISVTGGSSGNGNGTVSYSVGSNSSSNSRNGTIAIAEKTFSVSQAGNSSPPTSGDYTYFAVLAHTTGSNNSVWQSSLALCNTTTHQASVSLTYRFGTSSSVTRSATVPANGIVEWKDAPVDLFNVGERSSGVVTIDVDAPLMVAVRTFNSSASGTFGQSLPGVTASRSMTVGETGILSPVRRTSDFRTNIGVLNTGTKNCTVNVHFMNGNGHQIGSTITVNLAKGAWKQINEALSEAGISYADGAYAVVETATAGAAIWAYATVIDNSSGDPTALRLEIVE